MVTDCIHLVEGDRGVGEVGDDEGKVATASDRGEQTEASEQAALRSVDGDRNLTPARMDVVTEFGNKEKPDSNARDGGPRSAVLEVLGLWATGWNNSISNCVQNNGKGKRGGRLAC